MMWLKNLLVDLEIKYEGSMPMFCDNHVVIFIASNPAFHERTKHIEVDCHFVRDTVSNKLIHLPYVKSEEKLTNVFTKAEGPTKFSTICKKLGMVDIYALA